MDIGKQQRVIIVEQIEVPAQTPEPVAEPEPVGQPVGEWPLPYELEPEPVR